MAVIDMEILNDIVCGIPRRFSLHSSTVIFYSIDWHCNGSFINSKPVRNQLLSYNSFNNKLPIAGIGHVYPSAPQNFLAPCIILQNDWWIPNRHRSLWALVELTPPEDNARRFDDINSEIRLKAECLGQVKNELFIVAPTEVELIDIENKDKRAKEITKNIDGLMMSFINSHDLPYTENDLTRIPAGSSGISVKDSIIQYYKPRGYKYNTKESNLNLYNISKTTDYNSLIKLTFDSGKFGGQLSCRFSFVGHLWNVSYDLIICKGINNKTILYQERNDVDRIVENVGMIIDYLEVTIIKELNDIYGKVPSWYKY